MTRLVSQLLAPLILKYVAPSKEVRIYKYKRAELLVKKSLFSGHVVSYQLSILCLQANLPRSYGDSTAAATIAGKGWTWTRGSATSARDCWDVLDLTGWYLVVVVVFFGTYT